MTMSSLLQGRSNWFYPTWEWDDWGGFRLPSLRTTIGEQLAQGRCAVARDFRFKPFTLWLQGMHLSTSPTQPFYKNFITVIYCRYLFNLSDILKTLPIRLWIDFHFCLLPLIIQFRKPDLQINGFVIFRYIPSTYSVFQPKCSSECQDGEINFGIPAE